MTLSTKWMDDALCAQIGGDEFFPDQGGSTKLAKEICGMCEVRAECLEYALEDEIRTGVQMRGIWGGTSPSERVKIRAARGFGKGQRDG